MHNLPSQLPDEGVLDPHSVRYSQDSIRATFKDGTTIDRLVAGLRSGEINPGDIPSIRVLERDGALFTLDNRRLWVFQQVDRPIPYRKATQQEIEREFWKFKPADDGRTIRVRGRLP